MMKAHASEKPGMEFLTGGWLEAVSAVLKP